MTLAQLLTLVSTRLDDTKTPRLWSDVELTSYFNEIINSLCERAPVLIDFVTTAICNISVLTTTATYATDPRIIRILEARLALVDSPLGRISWHELSATNPTWRLATGTPQAYMTDMGSDTIVLYPKPIVADTLYLGVARYPLLPLDSTVTPSMNIEIPERFQSLLIPGVTAMAYRKPDAETENLVRAKADEIEWLGNVESIKQFYLKKNESSYVAVPHQAFM